MAFTVGDNSTNLKISRNLETAQRDHTDSLEKLSSGQVFTQQDPRPAERALAEGLEFRLRSLASSKRNINDGVSMLQTAESGLAEINNMITRMREINVASSTTTINDRERRYLLIEYQALHDEIDRVATTTEFNGLPLLNGASEKTPEALILRLGDPSTDSENGEDVNTIRFEGLKKVVATTEGLGIRSAKELLESTNENGGVSIDDVNDLMAAENNEVFATVYDEALDTLSQQRAVFGAMQSRLNRASDYVDVYQENIAAAKSKIADTDYAREVANLTKSNILMQAGTSLLAQSNVTSALSLSLLNTAIR